MTRSPDRMQLHYAETLMPRKACFVARHLGSPVDFIAVDMAKGEHKAPAFRALNPNGKVPLLVDGDLALWESDAIMVHLALGAGSDLWPSDPRGQVEAQRWLSWAAHEFNPQAGTLYFEHVIRPMFGMGEVDAAAEAEALARTRRGLAVLDTHMAERTFILGSRLSLADVSVAVTFPYAEKANIPLRDYPAVARWNDRLLALPHWDAPFPQHAA
ncbi:MAG: glutathione S-transferase family protein [Phreatobacter sp.]|uniref:glutathione S-transferase family protein n=1 Tax=Phreatobacter sp. TaxID=1966341 RepID=UPI004035427F